MEQRGVVAIQCDTVDGQRGTFLFRETEQGRQPISPVFTSLVDLYPWLDANGWRAVHNSTEPTGEYTRD